MVYLEPTLILVPFSQSGEVYLSYPSLEAIILAARQHFMTLSGRAPNVSSIGDLVNMMDLVLEIVDFEVGTQTLLAGLGCLGARSDTATD
jgi:hypothetical protein